MEKGIYELIERLNTGLLYERCVERDLVRLLEHYQAEGEGLEDTNIYTSVRGVPLVFHGIDVTEAGALEKVREKTSYIVVVVSDYMESDGEEWCTARVVVSTSIHDGADQVARHELWCAAVRGIMSKAAQAVGVLQIANRCAEEMSFSGWEKDESPATMQYGKAQWIWEETYTVRACRQ